MNLRALLLASALLSCTGTARAAPVAADQRVPIDLRRTTLIVRDMETALHFYRDAVGLHVAYDHVIRTPRSAANDDEAQKSLRLVLLRANDDFVGMLGLIEYRKPLKPAPSANPVPFSIGSMVLVFNTKNVAERLARARQVPGVKVVEEPARTTYPSYGGEGVIPVMVSTLQDPDGYVIELNELLTEPVK